MDKKQVRRVSSVFSEEPLTTYKGNPLFNLNFLAVAFLYDFPSIAGNPRKLYQAIKRCEEKRASDKDKVVVEVLKKRLSSFTERKEVAEKLTSLES